MPKNILIFSDGTGQFGGLRPDQRLSNVYKMYRAMRPGPDSPISYEDQIAYYDPGLGAGEADGLTLRKIKNGLEAAVGTGIDSNVIDCYEKILEFYQPGDRIFLFGFSRGAYTVRSLANVMNLCGIPTRMPDWRPLPPQGPELRKIAREAVKSVYGHGAGKPRNAEPYFSQREEKGRRFRNKFGSTPMGEEPNVQGNVQPDFIGVFDTVAALGSAILKRTVKSSFAVATALLAAAYFDGWSNWLVFPILGVTAVLLALYIMAILSNIRLFSPDQDKPLRWFDPRDWPAIARNFHLTSWNRKNYDRWLDGDVGFARHALAIDEQRADFPRVAWGSKSESDKNAHKNPPWLKQVWFAGCHSDIGGSYLETESRLSDIALKWMIDELTTCFPSVQYRMDMLRVSPDPLALQHEEALLKRILGVPLKWRTKPRLLDPNAELHESVLKRLEADQVPHPEANKPYRPEQLRHHTQASQFYPQND